MAAIPNTKEEITAAWLGDVTGWDVQRAEVAQIGEGIGVSSALYRATLSGPGCPSTVVVKLQALDPAAVFTSTVLSMYRREVAFFSGLGALSPVRVPVGHHAEVSDDGSCTAIVMEDLGGHRFVDQVAGMEIADAERAIDGLAAWHAQWWNAVEGLAESGAAVPLGSPMYPAMLPMLFDEGWAKLVASANCVPPGPLLAVGPKFGGAVAALLGQLDASPNTLLHGDFRADNLLFAADGSLILIDFQLTGTGSPAYDLAYFITQSLDEDVATEHETRLVERWKDGAVSGGVDLADLGDLWDDYRVAALFCVAYPVIAARGADLDDARQAGLVMKMMSRLASAAERLQLADLL